MVSWCIWDASDATDQEVSLPFQLSFIGGRLLSLLFFFFVSLECLGHPGVSLDVPSTQALWDAPALPSSLFNHLPHWPEQFEGQDFELSNVLNQGREGDEEA